jgi:anti-sigma regulatory factor (Ser/Thr protein kinase)
MAVITQKYEVSGDDFSRAGEASSNIKRTLKGLGFEPELIRRVAIATYEAEINMVIHANGGIITASISPESVSVEFVDKGPGIPNIDLAMQEGWSTAPENVRELGFGAGMGLPNIKKYTDYFDIQSEVGVGTKVTIRIEAK